MKHEKIILNMLLLSEFTKLESNSTDKHRFLLLEPLIIDLLDGEKAKTHKNILDDLDSFKPDNNTIYNLLEKYKDDKIIFNKDQNLYSLEKSEKVKDKISKYNKKRETKKSEWNTFKNYALRVISKSKHTSINEFNIDEHFFNFYTEILYTNIPDMPNRKLFNKDVNIEIGLFLEECHKNENSECFLVMENLLQGIFRTKAVLCGINGLNSGKLPIIYLDNVFMSNLFGWCNNMHYYSCKMIFEQLKSNKFKLKIHNETFDIIIKSIRKCKKMIANKRSISYDTYFHYMKNIEPNNIVFDINKIPLANMNNSLIEKLKEYEIAYDPDELGIDADSNDPKYTEIENARKQINDAYYVSESQTDYDYKIVKNYGTNTSISENTLSNMKEIFLTYQQAIIKSAYNNSEDITYTPIMSVRKFSKLLLLENSVNNNNNSKLLQAIIKETYSNDLSKSIIDFLTKVLEDAHISDPDKKLIIAHSLDTDNWGDILTADSIKDILTDLKSKDGQIKQLEEDKKEIAEKSNIEFKNREEEHNKKLQKALYDKDEEHNRKLEKAIDDRDKEHNKKLQKAIDDRDEEHSRKSNEEKKVRREKIGLVSILFICFIIIGITIFLCIQHKIWTYPWGTTIIVGLAVLGIGAFFAFVRKTICLLKSLN